MDDKKPLVFDLDREEEEKEKEKSRRNDFLDLISREFFKIQSILVDGVVYSYMMRSVWVGWSSKRMKGWTDGRCFSGSVGELNWMINLYLQHRRARA